MRVSTGCNDRAPGTPGTATAAATASGARSHRRRAPQADRGHREAFRSRLFPGPCAVAHRSCPSGNRVGGLFPALARELKLHAKCESAFRSAGWVSQPRATQRGRMLMRKPTRDLALRQPVGTATGTCAARHRLVRGRPGHHYSQWPGRRQLHQPHAASASAQGRTGPCR